MPSQTKRSWPFAKVQDRELRHILARRKAVLTCEPDKNEPVRPKANPHAPLNPHDVRPFGVAFSGGGIRSATFNLGLLQGLSELGLLKYVDYLSTVSGGGYIGSWLHSALHHRPESSKNVDEAVKSFDAPVSFLRKHSNYLAVRPGLFSGETWVMALIWLRNVLLNQLILIPALSIVLLLAAAFVHLEQLSLGPTALVVAQRGVLPLMVLIAVVLATLNLRAEAGRTLADDDVKLAWEGGTKTIVTLLFVAAVGLLWTDLFDAYALGIVLYMATCIIFQLGGGFGRCYRIHNPDHPNLWVLHTLWMSAVVSIVGVAFMFAMWGVIDDWQPWNRLTFGPPLICLSVIGSTSLLVGLMGADYPDSAREWIARLTTQIVLLCVGWMAVFMLTIHLPYFLVWAIGDKGGVWLAALGGWLGTTAAGVLVGRSAQSDSPEKTSSRSSRWLMAVAPPVFMVGYLLLLSFAIHAALLTLGPPVIAPAADMNDAFARIREYGETFHNVFEFGSGERFWWAVLLMLGCAVVTIVASLRININEFSLHHFYKNRLVRCFLGAGQTTRRRPNPVTGFDPRDDFPIATLRPHGKAAYHGPYPIINTALNLNVGAELARQERRATSFVFTPMYCGFEPTIMEDAVGVPGRAGGASDLEGLQADGYQPTRGYSSPAGPSLGTAMAISGAASNPNMGHNTSGPMAFLLTVFDARLGWWLGNPRWPKRSTWPGPPFALWYLLSELLAQTRGDSHFVNLSDGGHFDNLGLYELVRRRCRFIIVGDAEQDGDLTFGSLGGAVRKCRTDFGVEIDIDPRPITLSEGVSGAHCVVGTITYPEAEPDPAFTLLSETPADRADRAGDRARGFLVYVKSSVTGDEPADVIEYRASHADFPHQSTGDQFFSESQFESYRRLGLHAIRDVFEGILPLKGERHGELLDVFRYLTRKWYAPPAIGFGDMTRLNEGYTSLIRRLGDDERLYPLIPALVADFPADPESGAAADARRMLFVEVIQLMENVYTEFKLEHPENRSNPRNAGWMASFRRWALDPGFLAVWGKVGKDYHPLFQMFVNQLGQEYGDVPPRK